MSGNRVIKQNLIVDRLLRKLKKTYAKMLSAYARRKLAKAYELEDKAIRLELELKDEQS